ncbi:tetratricopeptide repeat protein [Vibrio fluminensis]|uniref:tetratricopeptide repeat protein n=1 Tax=Vibrio fluminensis TaxID=2783614 RepID=UPI001888D3A7
MRKLIQSTVVSTLLISMLQGCVASGNTKLADPEELSLETQERVLLASNNTVGLIEFYQQQLKQHDSEDYRIKLAEVYLKKHDPESALFTLSPLMNKAQISVKSSVVAAKAHMDLGDFEVALPLLEQAYKQAPNDGEIANLLGVVYAEQGQLKLARKMFEAARSQFYNDLKIKNNLALLDILEGDYVAALDRLSSVASDPQLDKQTRANLLLVMAKNGQEQMVMRELDDSLTSSQKRNIYLALRNTSLKVSDSSAQSESETDIEASAMPSSIAHELSQ